LFADDGYEINYGRFVKTGLWRLSINGL